MSAEDDERRAHVKAIMAGGEKAAMEYLVTGMITLHEGGCHMGREHTRRIDILEQEALRRNAPKPTIRQDSNGGTNGTNGSWLRLGWGRAMLEAHGKGALQVSVLIVFFIAGLAYLRHAQRKDLADMRPTFLAHQFQQEGKP